MRFVFIEAEKATYPVRVLCRVLEVSAGGFYEWRRRRPGPRAQQDQALRVRIAAIHKQSEGCYGSPRIHRELREQKHQVGRHRVARLMRQQGLSGLLRRRFRRTTDSQHDQPVAPHLLERRFTVSRPNEVWVADLTYIRTWEGWLYLAVILDLYSRRVVGYCLAEHLRVELVLGALEMALGRRRPEGPLMHHSDQGSQYAAALYQKKLSEAGLVCSMSRKGNCWDNAVVESFFGSLKTELIHRRVWPTRRSARSAIHAYIELFYNSQRRHSYLGYKSPVEYETLFEEQAALAA